MIKLEQGCTHIWLRNPRLTFMLLTDGVRNKNSSDDSSVQTSSLPHPLRLHVLRTVWGTRPPWQRVVVEVIQQSVCPLRGGIDANRQVANSLDAVKTSHIQHEAVLYKLTVHKLDVCPFISQHIDSY